MNDCIAELYDYICEKTKYPWDNPDYKRAVQAYSKIKEEVKEKIGDDLFSQYQCAELDVFRWDNLATFSQTICLFHRFMLEILDS